MSKTDKVFIVCIVFLLSLLLGFITQPLNQNGELSEMEQRKLEAGEIVQVAPWQKYGDDVKPKQSAVFCRILPFKRYVGDDQVHCWTEKKI